MKGRFSVLFCFVLLCFNSIEIQVLPRKVLSIYPDLFNSPDLLTRPVSLNLVHLSQVLNNKNTRDDRGEIIGALHPIIYLFIMF
jgi:hypothetical protein